ncbi:MAG: biotin/lipoyl-binding carrier protein [Burkholderiaceae bacterium]|nr:biotin/lipoyl-binding carrier protein [Burkholderiaceae bacterium]
MATYEARSEVTGSVWKITTEVGQQVGPGDTLMIIESMKMEIPVVVEDGGTVLEFRVAEGVAVAEGEVVAVLQATKG